MLNLNFKMENISMLYLSKEIIKFVLTENNVSDCYYRSKCNLKITWFTANAIRPQNFG